MRSPYGARSFAALITTALVATAGTLAAAAPADAASIPADVPQVALAYTDSANPTTTYSDPTGDLPLGTWTDSTGATHQSQIYATYDLSGFTGTDILTSTLFTGVDTATNCTADDIEVWRTAVPSAPVTWDQAPKATKELGTVGLAQPCAAPYLTLDLTAAAIAALASGSHELSIELQLIPAEATDASFGRWISGPSGPLVSVTYDTAPAVPVNLFNEYQNCSTKPTAPTFVPSTTPVLEGQTRDADSDDPSLTSDFLVWPVSDPSQTTAFSGTGGNGFENGAIPPTPLTDGVTYAWQMRAYDGNELSGWSKTCYITVDSVNPAIAPVVTSSNYPANQTDPGGTPVNFTFSPNGLTDVSGYEFSWEQDLPVYGVSIGPYGVPEPVSPFADTKYFVQAPSVGAAVTLNLVPPAGSSGPQTLYVRSLSQSYNPSPTAEYSFYLPSTSPTITSAVAKPRFDVPTVFTLTPNPAVGKVTSYTVTLNNVSQTVRANASGKAKVTLTFTTDGNFLDVTSTSANGWLSSDATSFFTFDTSTKVKSDVYLATGSHGGVGIPGDFAFSTSVSTVANYTYSFGDTTTTVPAGPGGIARITWTPDASGMYFLTVYGTTTDGTVLDTTYYIFTVK